MKNAYDLIQVKKFSKAWFKEIVNKAFTDNRDSKIVLDELLDNLADYLKHLDKIDANRGKGTSERRVIASRENGKKGGWKKGVPRKKNWFVANNEGEVIGHDMDKASAIALAQEMAEKEPSAEWEAMSDE